MLCFSKREFGLVVPIYYIYSMKNRLLQIIRCLVAGIGAFSIIVIIPGAMASLSGQDRYAEARENMVKYQIEAEGVRNKATLDAMRKVPRHLFVPDALKSMAYHDTPLPIGYDQTISQPYMVAYMTEAIRPGAGMKVLEIGTGSGYQAAVLAEIVDDVYTIEIVEPLGKASAALLSRLGYSNVHVRIGDGFAGWPEKAPFDAIVVTAAAGELPPPLFAQLKEGGRMVIPLGKPGSVQTLVLITKIKGKAVRRSLLPVRFVPFVREEGE